VSEIAMKEDDEGEFPSKVCRQVSDIS
jgi:hypothetical protein